MGKNKQVWMEKSPSILIIALNGIGNTLLATPLMKNIKKSSPKAKIAVLCLCDSIGAVMGNPHVDEVIVYPGNKNIWKRASFLWRMRKRTFDLSFYVYPNVNIMSALMGILIGARCRVNFKYRVFGAWCGLFDSVSILPNLQKHDIEKNLDLLGPFGVKATLGKIKIPIQEQDREKVDKMLKGRVSREDILIGMHVGSKESMRIWPTENFARIVELLSKHKNLKIVLVGTKIEEELIEGFKEFSSKNVINLISKTTIPQTTEVIKRCKVFVTTDSGPMHMAVAAGTKVIAVYLGPHIMRTAPYGKEHVVYLTNDTTKNADRNKNHRYMKNITPKAIADEILLSTFKGKNI